MAKPTKHCVKGAGFSSSAGGGGGFTVLYIDGRKFTADEVAERMLATLKPPYPFCRTPEKCTGKGYCDAEIACND